MQSPLVSIITPCYKASTTLPKTVESILAQTFTDWELILVDDCSPDDTCDQAQAYCDADPRIHLIRQQKNGGAAVARNAGIDLAKGRYIAFLDADDSWLPHKLENQLKLMQENNWPLSYTGYTRNNSEGHQINQVGVPPRLSYRDLLKTNYIGCSTAIYDTETLSRVHMPNLRKRQDFGLWLRILKKTPFAYGINEPMTIYLVQENSLSANKRSSAAYNWQLYRHEEGLTLLVSAYYFAHYAIRGLLRTRFPALATALGLLHKPSRQ